MFKRTLKIKEDKNQNKVTISFNENLTRSKENKASVLISKQVFEEERILTGCKIATYSFKNDKLFVPRKKSEGVIGSVIFAVEIQNITLENLTTPIQFSFKSTQTTTPREECVFWDKGTIYAQVVASFSILRACNKDFTFISHKFAILNELVLKILYNTTQTPKISIYSSYNENKFPLILT